ncbi:MAG: hypothetical protein PHP35_02985 [Candidatus Colwellbacteria bacterium]|nr:hypothetical protein [Candidatus Colwellbacteria bacterium]
MIKVQIREEEGKDRCLPVMIFLPGFGDTVHSRSLNKLIKNLTSISSKVVIITSEETDRYPKGVSLYETHAEAIFANCRQFIKRSVIVGYSEGGLKAVWLTRIAQESGEAPAKTILLESVGLYKQSTLGLMAKFFLSGLLSIWRAEVIMTFMDVIWLIIRRAILRGKVLQMAREAKEMSCPTSLIGITVPVIAISCRRDLISNPDRISLTVRKVVVKGWRYGHEFPVVFPEKLIRIITGL